MIYPKVQALVDAASEEDRAEARWYCGGDHYMETSYYEGETEFAFYDDMTWAPDELVELIKEHVAKIPAAYKDSARVALTMYDEGHGSFIMRYAYPETEDQAVARVASYLARGSEKRLKEWALYESLKRKFESERMSL